MFQHLGLSPLQSKMVLQGSFHLSEREMTWNYFKKIFSRKFTRCLPINEIGLRANTQIDPLQCKLEQFFRGTKYNPMSYFLLHLTFETTNKCTGTTVPIVNIEVISAMFLMTIIEFSYVLATRV